MIHHSDSVFLHRLWHAMMRERQRWRFVVVLVIPLVYNSEQKNCERNDSEHCLSGCAVNLKADILIGNHDCTVEKNVGLLSAAKFQQ